jgi:GNAT superfamily N-acetyltransferase
MKQVEESNQTKADEAVCKRGVMRACNSQVTLQSADPLGEEAMRLLREMRVEAVSRYNDVIDTSAPPPINDPLVPRSVFLIARLDNRTVGCAALRPIDTETAEVRRMYVAPAVRRRGIARRLLAELERIAAGFGYCLLRLETGNRQPEAITLYESYGFRRIASYGCHVGDALSICFEKKVTNLEIVSPHYKLATSHRLKL